MALRAAAWGLCLLGTLAAAQPAAPGASTATGQTSVDQGGVAWRSLTAPQREVLAPLQADWASIEPSRKAKWLELATRFRSLPVEEQQRIQQRMVEWARLSPAERGRARLSFQESKQIPREEKQARWEAYQALPEDERQALAQRSKRAADRPAAAGSGAAASLSAAQPKRNASPAASASSPLVKPVAPTVVQAKPGATTTLMSRPAGPPSHQAPGQPKITASPSDVDRSTLLPRSGPQAAAPASATHP